MNTKEFAEKYAGWMVRFGNYDGNDAIVGRVIGWGDGGDYDGKARVHIEVDGLIPNNLSNIVKVNYTIDPLLIKSGVYRYQPEYLYPINRPTLLPDDCFDCGAVGEEFCNPGCPNKGV